MDRTLNVEEIRALIPHRYPMLLVDRIQEMVPGERVVGVKNVTINEPFFDGHFPGHAVMPGVLIVEAMAQVAGLIMLALPDHEGKLVYIAGIENVRFRRPVVPGDTLTTEANMVWLRGSMGKVHMVGRVGDSIVAEGEMKFALKDRDELEPVHNKIARMLRDTNGRSGNNAGGHRHATRVNAGRTKLATNEWKRGDGGSA